MMKKICHAMLLSAFLCGCGNGFKHGATKLLGKSLDVYLGLLLLGKVLVVERIENELLSLLFQTTDVHRLVASHNLTCGVYEYQQNVTGLNLLVLNLNILGWQWRKHT